MLAFNTSPFLKKVAADPVGNFVAKVKTLDEGMVIMKAREYSGAEDFSLEPAGNPGYNCGGFGCSYSAYVLDNCQAGETNWCWLR